MNIAILSLLIVGQVVLLQILAALGNRSIIRRELRHLGGPIPDTLTRYAHRAPVLRIALGVLLGGLALLPLAGLLPDLGTGKLLLVCVSLASSAAFVVTNTHDRKRMRLLADLAPGGSVRRASLERRSLRQWYHPALEALPILIFAATLIFLAGVPGFISTGDAPPLAGRTHILLLFGLQGLLIFGSLYYSLRKGVDVKSMAMYIPSLRRRPEAALRLGEELAGTQIRFFIFARIGIAALLAVTIVGKVLVTSGDPSAFLWSAIRWGLLGLLLLGFFFYLKKVGRVSRRMQQEMELSNHETASAG
jgi:hypothetical protein